MKKIFEPGKIKFLENEILVLAGLGLKISQTPFKKGSGKKLYFEILKNKKEIRTLVNQVMEKHRHLIFGDFLPYAILFENISRLFTLYFWRNVSSQNLIFGAGIEASLRVIQPNLFHPAIGSFGKRCLFAYKKAISLGVPEQDARYLLPEAVLTRMIFSAPPRYLIKISNSLKEAPLFEIKKIGEELEKIVKLKFKLKIPKENLISDWRFFGKSKIKRKFNFRFNGDQKSISLDLPVKGSLSMYAQLVRQRQILCEIEPLEEISKRGEFVIPPTFSKKVIEIYKEIAKIAKEKQEEFLKKKDPRFAYFLLLGQRARGIIYGKGAGIVELSRARSEGVAQWEIRNEIGIRVTEILSSSKKLKKEIGPRCWREGICLEPQTFKTKKNICKAFLKSKGRWKGSLESLLSILKEDYKIFKV